MTEDLRDSIPAEASSTPWIDSDMAYPWPVESHDALGPGGHGHGTSHLSQHDDVAWHPSAAVPRPPMAARSRDVLHVLEDARFSGSWRQTVPVSRADPSVPVNAHSGKAGVCSVLRETGVAAPGSRKLSPVLARSLKAAGAAGATGTTPKKQPKARTPKSPKAPRKDGGTTPRSRGGASPKPDNISYSDMLMKMPASPDAHTLLNVYLRDELRSLLKRNGVSYHKPGRANLMKSKIEMAADLLGTLLPSRLLHALS